MTRKNGKTKDLESGFKEQQHKLVDRQQQQLLLNSNSNSNKAILAQQESGDSDLQLNGAIGGSNNNNNNNDSANNSAKKPQQMMAYCLRQKWILLLSMSLTFIIGLLLLALLTASWLDTQNKGCFDAFPFHQPNYKLFSTKTSYSTAFSYLNTHNPSLSSSPLSPPVTTNQIQSVTIPDLFSRTESLKSIDSQLKSEQCRVKQFHFFGRHASRYPSSSEVEFINRNLANVQQRLELAKFSISPPTSSPASAQNDSQTELCLNPLIPYKQWVTPLLPERGNRLMDSGFDETMAIAQRLRSIYPDMFNSNVSKIELGTTDELRTAQTATAFLKLCNQSLDQDSDNKVDECQRDFLNKYSREKLQFHKKCQSYHRNNLTIQHHLNVDEPTRTKFIIDSLSKNLKLTDEDKLSPNEAQAIYKICKYESALVGTSIWCNLFFDSDLKFYEYLSDIGDFYNQTYGHPNQHKSACPVTGDLYRAFKNARSQTTPESYFYFTHSEVIQKIFASSVDLEKDPAYSPELIRQHLKTGTVPQTRQWRTSLITPFAANLAFTLYECPTTLTPSSDGTIEFKINGGLGSLSNFKVVASLNEQPILLDGCSSEVCNLDNLFEDSRIFEVKRCKLEDICSDNIVVT